MPALDQSGSPVIHPSLGTHGGYSLAELEMGKFSVNNGSVSLNTNASFAGDIEIGAVEIKDGGDDTRMSVRAEGTTIGTANVPLFGFRETGGTVNAVGTAHPFPVTEQSLLAGEDLTNNVSGVLTKPVNSTTYSPSLAVNIGGSLTTLAKASAGNVYSVHYTNLSAAVCYLQFFNVATVAPIGSVPVYSFPVNGGTSTLVLDNTFFSPSHNFTTGISIGVSTAVGTLGTTGLTAANHILHTHYV